RDRYRRCRNPVERRYWQVLWLVAQGMLTREISEEAQLSPRWVGELVRRYNREGPEAMRDGRKGRAGRPPLLSTAQRMALEEVLRATAPDGGEWTGSKVAAWMSEQLGRPVAAQRGWDYLRRLGFTFHSGRAVRRAPARVNGNGKPSRWRRRERTQPSVRH
ncbi:MAG: helix-turn-helix domain-containing protein, partial [Armatimonadetes bacterium]|nr:helix-turn-helix domain-containing protein [Armatimonadota bacterium]